MYSFGLDRGKQGEVISYLNVGADIDIDVQAFTLDIDFQATNTDADIGAVNIDLVQERTDIEIDAQSEGLDLGS